MGAKSTSVAARKSAAGSIPAELEGAAHLLTASAAAEVSSVPPAFEWTVLGTALGTALEVVLDTALRNRQVALERARAAHSAGVPPRRALLAAASGSMTSSEPCLQWSNSHTSVGHDRKKRLGPPAAAISRLKPCWYKLAQSADSSICFEGVACSCPMAAPSASAPEASACTSVTVSRPTGIRPFTGFTVTRNVPPLCARLFARQAERPPSCLIASRRKGIAA